jgi:hypothetical protein
MRVLPWVFAAALAAAWSSSSAGQRTPRVTLVQPSGSSVPANLLRISIEFESPVEGPVLARLALLRANGQSIQQPFLDQELWSPNARTLTVLLHPGRIKTGLLAREELGPIFVTGDEVAVALDGRPLKHWRVGAPDQEGPSASAWKISSPTAGSKTPVVVALDGAIESRDVDYLAIADARGRRVPGHVRLLDGEKIWTFVPRTAWRAGAYKLAIRGTLEDPAGNRLGSRFETSIDAPPGRPVDAAVSFDLRANSVDRARRRLRYTAPTACPLRESGRRPGITAESPFTCGGAQ